ncbi:Hypothetical protein SFBmNL_01292 [Candidatus Arthromitus sp. SFB-mouse-NL]|uniref:hypothetical protein n=1 Tax=Candidatus Arthromitus sp. SFB-mouse-NL TaxID=1508644 RepID=UPI00049A28F8|nr:hypothetical protein [Candidatus Arthromitus sp. SFB-mouse-NL]AID45196.1 Hypothetical protein SFBmNL_01292 [Candidatus Arthromitus sp. SFB-mouse-NL]
MNNRVKNFILAIGCLLVFLTGMVQGESVVSKEFSKKFYSESTECSHDKKIIGKHKESIIKLLEYGKFDEVKKNVLDHLDSKISFMEKEIEKYKGENDNEKVERLEGRISKIKEVREKINSAKFKDEIKNILDSEFKHRGKCKNKCKDKKDQKEQ